MDNMKYQKVCLKLIGQFAGKDEGLFWIERKIDRYEQCFLFAFRFFSHVDSSQKNELIC